MSQPSSSEQAHAKLDKITSLIEQQDAREAQKATTQAAILSAMNYCAEALGTLVVEVAELSKAAANEPQSDIGAVMRRLAEAVEQNTDAIRGLVTTLTPPRGGTH